MYAPYGTQLAKIYLEFAEVLPNPTMDGDDPRVARAKLRMAQAIGEEDHAAEET